MGYHLNIDVNTKTVHAGRYITNLRAILVGGSDPKSVEEKIGYTPGSLSAGYWLLVLADGAHIGKEDFELRGYTYLEDGKALGEEKNVHQHFMQRLSTHQIDRQNRERLLQEVGNRLNRTGLDRVAKVSPVSGDKVQYKPGTGVNQYYLHNKKLFNVIGKVLPGQKIERSANGKLSIV